MVHAFVALKIRVKYFSINWEENFCRDEDNFLGLEKLMKELLGLRWYNRQHKIWILWNDTKARDEDVFYGDKDLEKRVQKSFEQ